MKKLIILFAFFTLLLITGCADVSQIQYMNPSEHVYGFWGGTWHGMITIPSFIGSLIWNDVAIYAVNNNGGWYDFGFIGGFYLIVKVIKTMILGVKSAVQK
jgi:hypothetical protein